MGDIEKERIARQAQRQLGLISTQQVIKAGATQHLIRTRVEAKEWQPIHRGWFKIGFGALSPEQKLLAAQLVAGPDAVLSHFSAAKKLGLVVPSSPQIHVSIPGARRGGRMDGVKIHRVGELPPEHTTRRGAFRVTTVERTVIDLAASLDAKWLGALLDSASGQSRANWNRIVHLFLRQRRERPGMALLGQLLYERSKNAEITDSALESFALELSRQLGVAPVLQHPLTLASGRKIHVDFGFPEHRLAIEFDGFEHHSSRWSFNKDRERDRGLFALNWSVLRFPWEDVVHHQQRTIRELGAALAKTRPPAR